MSFKEYFISRSPLNKTIPDSRIRSVETLKTTSKTKKGKEKTKSTYRSDIEDTNIETGQSAYLTTKENKRGRVTNTFINPDGTGYKDVTSSKGKIRGHKTSKVINKARVKKSKKILDAET